MEERSRKLCLVCHCILNCNSKVEGPCRRKGPLKEVLYPLIEKDYGIIQLPCPEMTYYGMRRWGHVREQFDNPYFRKHCRTILEPVITQVEEYLSNNYRLDYIVGLNGSPSCGVDMSCSSEKWMGELSKWDSLESIKSSLSYKQVPGVFIEELINMLEEKSIEAEFVGVYESRISEFNFYKIFK
jgi:predicted secreted protein